MNIAMILILLIVLIDVITGFNTSTSAHHGSSCIYLSATSPPKGNRAVVGLYTGDHNAILLEDISAAVNDVLSARTYHMGIDDLENWKLCVNFIATDVSAVESPDPEADSSDQLERPPPSRLTIASTLPLIQPLPSINGNYRFNVDLYEGTIVQVDSLIDTVADVSACAVSTGNCNFRSAVAYCEQNLITSNDSCVVNLPVFATILMDPVLGEIDIDNVNGGKIDIKGNGCVVHGDIASSSTARLMNIGVSSPFQFTMTNMTVNGFGGEDLLGGAMFFSGFISVILKDIIFSNDTGYMGGSVYLDACSNAIISNCTFINSYAHHVGGALYLHEFNTDIAVMDSTFTNTSAFNKGGAIYMNQANYNVTIHACVFTESSAYWYGGAIYMYRHNDHVAITECSFVDTVVHWFGAAIYMNQFNVDASINMCTFTSAVIHNGGGIVYLHEFNHRMNLSSCIFANNTARYGGGVFLYQYNNAAIISSSTFTDISVPWVGGGVYLYQYNDYVAISTCTFINTMAEYGGALYVDEFNSGMTLTNCTFADTSADYGGAIYMSRANHDAVVSGSIFTNTSASNGGAMYSYEFNARLLILNCTFYGIVAHQDGGAVHIRARNHDVIIRSVLFTSTFAVSDGGAIYMDLSNENVAISDVVCTDTHSGGGGGAIFINSDNHNTTVFQCNFTDTSAGKVGGAIYLYSSNHRFDVAGCMFSNSSAGVDGGAIYIYVRNNDVIVTSTEFKFNVANEGGSVYIGNTNNNIKFENALFFHNHGLVSGGAMQINSDNTATIITRCIFDGNSAIEYGGGIEVVSSNTGINIEYCTFNNNSAASGGGAIHSSVANSDLSIYLCRIHNNFASFGGGIYIGDYHENILVSSTSFDDNAAESGAGVYITRFNNGIVFQGAILRGNDAAVEGGAIYVLADDISIMDSRLLNNAALNSGALYAQRTYVIVDSCIISGNRGESMDGEFGGFHVVAASAVRITSTQFMNNSAGDGGAIGIIDCEAVSIENCTFITNTALQIYGGAIVSISSNINIYDSMFSGNTARTNGGGVYLIGADREVVISDCVFDGNVVSVDSGSAVWISTSINVNIANNTFYSNQALQGGGTVYWVSSTMLEPIHVVTANNFTDSNEALYGSSVATDYWRLALDPTNIYNITDYTKNSPCVVVHLVDYYSQIVLTESTAVLVATVIIAGQCYHTSAGYVTGGFVERFESGVVNFTTLLAYCDPGYSMAVEIVEGSVQTSLNLYFRECVTGEYYGESVCVQCENGTYSVTEPSAVSSLSELTQPKVCLECPEGSSTCYGNTVLLKEGYWRISNQATTTLSCPYKDSCGGGSGTGDALCRDGYEGPVCGVCTAGYSFRSSSQQCEPCSDSAGLDAVTVFYLVVFGLVFAIAGLALLSPSFRANVKTIDDLYILGFVKLGLLNEAEHPSSTELIKEAAVIRRQFQARLKIYVSLWQIVSLLPFTLDLRFPSAYTSIVSVLNLFNLGVSVSSLVTCSSETSLDAIDNLVFQTLYPIVVVAILWLLQTTHLWWRRAEVLATRSHISSRYFKIFLVFTYLILPFVSVSIFQIFSCQDVDPDDVEPGHDSYMTVDYSVSCTSLKYQFGFFWALVSIVVYPLGIPVYYFYVLYSANYDIRSRDDDSSVEDQQSRNVRLESIKLLFEFYEPRFWYWEVVETTHRLLLTGVLLVIGPSSGAQIVVGIMIALFFVKVYGVCRPYVDDKVQTLRGLSQWQIYFVFFLALLLKADFKSVDRTALDALLILAIVANFVVDVLHVIWTRCCAGNFDWFADKYGIETVNPLVDNKIANETNILVASPSTEAGAEINRGSFNDGFELFKRNGQSL